MRFCALVGVRLDLFASFVSVFVGFEDTSTARDLVRRAGHNGVNLPPPRFGARRDVSAGEAALNGLSARLMGQHDAAVIFCISGGSGGGALFDVFCLRRLGTAGDSLRLGGCTSLVGVRFFHGFSGSARIVVVSGARVALAMFSTDVSRSELKLPSEGDKGGAMFGNGVLRGDTSFGAEAMVRWIV